MAQYPYWAHPARSERITASQERAHSTGVESTTHIVVPRRGVPRQNPDHVGDQVRGGTQALVVSLQQVVVTYSAVARVSMSVVTNCDRTPSPCGPPTKLLW